MIEDATTMVSVPKPQPTAMSIQYRRYALTMLFLVYMLNFVDRQIVNILAEPIKRELGLADWQLGSLTGLSFAIFYASLALPIARWAERANRVKIVALSAITWSLFTAVCGVAQNFTQLFLARVGVGVGEAGCTPASQSLISDLLARSMGSGDAIRWALISTSLVYVLAAAAFMVARKSIRQDMVS